jgi:hypothetical protein
VLLLPSLARAQVSTASLSVQVFGADDDALPGVSVEVLETDTGLQRSGLTDDSGSVSFQALPTGPYRVVAQLEGMAASAEQHVTLRVGQRAQLKLGLRPQVAEDMTVTGDIPLVDVFRMDSSTNIVPEQIEALPARDRQYERLALLTPGTQRDRAQYYNRTGAPVVGAGSNSAATGFLIDGADFTDSFFGLARVRVSQDAIEEFRVIGHRFDAEIGGSAGGVISVVTKSGGNQLRGSAFSFYRADSMRSKGKLEEDAVDFTRYHLGFTLGGPILVDEAHYFLSAEHVNQNDAAFFRPGGAFTQLAEDIPHPLKQNLALLSLDHQFGPSSLGIAKFLYERYREENYQVGGVRDQSRGWGDDRDHWNGLLGHTRVLGASRLNEFRLQVGGHRAEWPKNSEQMGELFSGGSTLSTGRDWVGENRGKSRLLEIRDTLHWMAGGEHQIKTGFSYLRLEHDYLFEMWDAGEMTYFGDDRLLPLVFTYGVGSSYVEMRSNLIGAFAQKDWLVSNDLTLSLGLRYDVDIGGNNPDFEHPLLPGKRGTDWDNLQPRLGFTWDLTEDGANLLRGGAGIFCGRYFATPSLGELQASGGVSRTLHSRINGVLFGLPPPYDLWLSADDPWSSGVSLPPSIWMLGESFRAPQSTQVTLGYGRRLGASNLHFDVEGIYVEGRNEVLMHDGNWAGNENPGRIDPAYTVIGRWVDDGRSRYEALALSLNGTIRGGHLIAASLTLADKRNLQDDPQGSPFPSDSADLEAEWGRSATDERYRLVVSGVFRLPWTLTLAPYFEYGSGQPWNRLLGYDFNGDFDYSDRPLGVPRNREDGPPFRQLSLRLTKAVPVGGTRHVELIAEAFNLFATANYDVTSIDGAMYFDGPTLLDSTRSFVPNPGFGRYRATLPPREIQLGLRYTF